MQKARIISAFPGCGKTTFFNQYKGDYIILDSDSSEFSWTKDDDGKNTKIRNPEFPTNYINHIVQNMNEADIIFVSSHKDVRDALNTSNIRFTLMYPVISIKKNWINRLSSRETGLSDKGFCTMMEQNYEKFIEELETSDYENCVRKMVINNSEKGLLDFSEELLSTNKVIAAYPGLGKTTLAKNNSKILDLDPGRYKYLGMENLSDKELELRKGDYTRKSNPNYPNNFIEAVIDSINKFELVLIHPHFELLYKLKERGVNLTIVYPTKDFFTTQLVKRYKERGNSDAFIASSYKKYVRDMPNNKEFEVVWLRDGYLSDIVK